MYSRDKGRGNSREGGGGGEDASPPGDRTGARGGRGRRGARAPGRGTSGWCSRKRSFLLANAERVQLHTKRCQRAHASLCAAPDEQALARADQPTWGAGRSGAGSVRARGPRPCRRRKRRCWPSRSISPPGVSRARCRCPAAAGEHHLPEIRRPAGLVEVLQVRT